MSETGDITIRVASNDYITLQLKSGDPLVVMNLAGADNVELHLDGQDGDIVCFSTADIPQKLFITDALNGIIQLRPESSDFDEAKKYIYYVNVIDSIGSHPVPEDNNYSWIVIGKITCP